MAPSAGKGRTNSNATGDKRVLVHPAPGSLASAHRSLRYNGSAAQLPNIRDNNPVNQEALAPAVGNKAKCGRM